MADTGKANYRKNQRLIDGNKNIGTVPGFCSESIADIHAKTGIWMTPSYELRTGHFRPCRCGNCTECSDAYLC